jgi:2-dehydro-3-deoxygalactonokinase
MAAWPNGKPGKLVRARMNGNALNAAHLIGLDWGSTGLRAFLIGADGQVLDARDAALGASVLQGADDYARALQDLAGDWLAARADLPVLACGMVGSKHGWQEVPYAACPAGSVELAQGMHLVPGQRVHIVPGLLYESEHAVPDVMRGEETQIVGALQLRPALSGQSCIVLPGTHSKWAEIKQGQVRGFATHMTGELFAVLRQHSVLGRLMPAAGSSGAFDTAAFLKGLDAARADGALGLTHQLFAVRTLGLTGKLPDTGLADYLSGLLIGHELHAGLAWRAAHGLTHAPLALIGEPGLCQRYAHALEHCGQAAEVLSNTAPAGLWCLAQIADPTASSNLARSSP